MGFFVHAGNDAGALVETLAELLAENRSVFVRDTVAVADKAVQQWLQLELALRNRIASNIEFPFPAKVVHTLVPGLPDTTDWTWRTFGLLQDCPEPKVQEYLRDDRSMLKRWNLALKLAGLFDQYQMFRTLEIRTETFWAAEPWQQKLFEEICPVSRGETIETFMAAVPEAKDLPFSRLFFFGLSDLPPLFIRLFKAVSSGIDVHFFVVTPQVNGAVSPLMKSWGGSLSNFSDQLTGCADETVFVPNVPAPDSMLKALQATLCGEKATSRTPDESLQVVSCHSIRREVEVLHQQLLSLFEADKNLQPEDVLITAPDVEVYMPHIEAVFSHASTGHLPVRCKTGDALGNSAAQLLLDLCGLIKERITAQDVFGLTARPLIQEKFGFDPEDLQQVRALLEETHFCWGLDGEDKKARFALPPVEDHSLIPALSRMVLGIALDDDDAVFGKGILPTIGMTGLRAEAATRLWALGAALRETLKDGLAFDGFEKGAKIQFFRTVLSRFVAESAETGPQLAQVERVLASLYEKIPSKVSLDVLCAALEHELLEAHHQNRLSITGGVSLCGLRKVGPVPFKVVAILGMNDGAFPGKDPVLSFNLMAQPARPEDPCTASGDRVDFLTAVMSAQSHLLISYVGGSMHRTVTQPAAVPVTELIDFVEQEICPAFECKQHPMQPFSSRYFCNEAGLKSYNRTDFEIADALCKQPEKIERFSQPLVREVDQRLEITPEELAGFFADAPKWFLERILEARVPSADETLPTVEPFDCDNKLTEYNLRAELLDGLIRGDDESMLKNKLLLAGALPPGELGGAVFTKQVVLPVKELHKEILSVRIGPVEFPEVRVELPSVLIQGSLGAVYNGGLIQWRPGDWKPKYLLKAWVYHLLAMRHGLIQPTLLVGWNKEKRAFRKRFNPVLKEEALKELSGFMELYKKGAKSPMSIFPDTAYAYTEITTLEPNVRLTAGRKKWEDGFNYTGEQGKGANPLIYKGVLPDDWDVISAKVFGALCAALEDVK